MVQWLKLHAANAGGQGLIPGQETRSHMPQIRVCMPKLRPGTAKQIKNIQVHIEIHKYLENILKGERKDTLSLQKDIK